MTARPDDVVAGLVAATALVVTVWVASLIRRDAGLIDRFWGLGFVLLTAVYAVRGDVGGWRPIVGAAMVVLWGVRLSWHIHRRNRGREEDYRYREMRERHGERFPWVSLFTVFLLQGTLMTVISVPLLQSQTVPGPQVPSAWDVVAVVLFVIGFLFEAIGDRQLTRFRRDPANRGRVLRTGLWRFTRHPNYFGDAVVWWSFFALAMATPGSLWTIVSPMLMTLLLMRVSGVTLLERKLVRTRPDYARYVADTSAFVPWPPRRR